MGNLTTFNFGGISDIRVLEKDGEAWFVGKDVASILGYTNPQKALRDHCKAAIPVGSVGVNESFTLDPQTKIVPERDVYRLIMRSKLPAAEQFEEWVVGTVLPAIRKTGGYIAGEEHAETEEELIYRAMEVMNRKIEAMKPKAEYHDKWMTSEGSYTTTEVAKKIGISAKKLNDFLRTEGIKWKNKDLPISGYEEWFDIIDRSYKNLDGDDQITSQCKVSPTGVEKIIDLWEKKNAA